VRSVDVDDLFNVKGPQMSQVLPGLLPVSERLALASAVELLAIASQLEHVALSCRATVGGSGRRCLAVKVPSTLAVEPPIEFVSRHSHISR